jgi:hypothetical protein
MAFVILGGIIVLLLNIVIAIFVRSVSAEPLSTIAMLFAFIVMLLGLAVVKEAFIFIRLKKQLPFTREVIQGIVYFENIFLASLASVICWAIILGHYSIAIGMAGLFIIDLSAAIQRNMAKIKIFSSQAEAETIVAKETLVSKHWGVLLASATFWLLLVFSPFILAFLGRISFVNAALLVAVLALLFIVPFILVFIRVLTKRVRAATDN